MMGLNDKGQWESGLSEFQASENEKTVISQRPAASPREFYQQMPLAELAEILEGRMLDHFAVGQLIGGGGMGAVFRGLDKRLDRVVAIKVIPAAKRDPAMLRRFRLEAQAAARLDHPNIARVFYVGEADQWDYIVFEFIDGINIRDLVEMEGPLSVDDAVYYTRQIAEALQHAHEREVVHRDIKPSNILVTASGTAKLVDMGLARDTSIDRSSQDRTASGITLGTFDYISPEQARNPRDADVRSDLYSLGCSLFFMLTGHPPFPEGTALQKLLNHGSLPPPDPRGWRDDLPEELYQILMKLMAKKPSDRYQKPIELVNDLMLLAELDGLPRSQSPATISITPMIAQPTLLETHLPWLVATAFLLGSTLWLQSLSLSSGVALPSIEFPVSQTSTTVPDSRMTTGPLSSGSQSSANDYPGSSLPGSSALESSHAPGTSSDTGSIPAAVSGPVFGNAAESGLKQSPLIAQGGNDQVGSEFFPSLPSPAGILVPSGGFGELSEARDSRVPVEGYSGVPGSDPPPSGALSNLQSQTVPFRGSSGAPMNGSGLGAPLQNQNGSQGTNGASSTVPVTANPTVFEKMGSSQSWVQSGADAGRTAGPAVESTAAGQSGGIAPNGSPLASINSALAQPAIIVSSIPPADVNAQYWESSLYRAVQRVASQAVPSVIEVRGSVWLDRPLEIIGSRPQSDSRGQRELVIRGGQNSEARIEVARGVWRNVPAGAAVISVKDSNLVLREIQLQAVLNETETLPRSIIQLDGNSSLDAQSCILTVQSNQPGLAHLLTLRQSDQGDSRALSNSLPDADAIRVAFNNCLIRGGSSVFQIVQSSADDRDTVQISLNESLVAVDGRVLNLSSSTGQRGVERIVRIFCQWSTFVCSEGFARLDYSGSAVPLVGLSRTAQACVFWSRPTVPHITITGETIDLLDNPDMLFLQGLNNAYDQQLDVICRTQSVSGRSKDLSFQQGQQDGWFVERANDRVILWKTPIDLASPFRNALPGDFELTQTHFVPGFRSNSGFSDGRGP